MFFFLFLTLSVQSLEEFYSNKNFSKLFNINFPIILNSYNYYISFSCFNFVFSTCISFSSSTSLTLYVEQSGFINCFGSSVGGAIYFSSASCILEKNYGFNCSYIGGDSGNSGQFFFIKVLKSNYNYLIDCSVSNCIQNNFFNSISLFNGNQLVKSLNSSFNRLNRKPGIYCYNSDINNMIYCSFLNNNGIMSISFRYMLGFSYLNYSNLINNTSLDYGVVYSGASKTFVYNCTFYNNLNILFIVVTSGFLDIFNCEIFHIFTPLTGGNVILKNTIPFYNTICLTYYSKNICSILETKKKFQRNINKFYFFLMF